MLVTPKFVMPSKLTVQMKTRTTYPIKFTQTEKKGEKDLYSELRGQSYKQFTLVHYNSRVVITSKLLIFKTLVS